MCVESSKGFSRYLMLFPLTTTSPLCARTDAPNHWCDLNSRGSLVPFTLIILLSGEKNKDGERGHCKSTEKLFYNGWQ